MDLSDAFSSMPSNVSLVVLARPEQVDFEIFAEEERLLAATTSPLRAAEYRLGRRAAHLAIKGIGCEPRPILRGPRREPLWPAGVTGSITHAGDYAIAAVALLSDVGGIGIDLEARDRYFPELENEIARDDELVALSQLEGRAREEATIEIFSAKESIYKAHYPRIGRYFGFDAVRVELGLDDLIGYFTEPLDPSFPVDRPMAIGRLWAGDSVLTWLVLPPDELSR